MEAIAAFGVQRWPGGLLDATLEITLEKDANVETSQTQKSGVLARLWYSDFHSSGFSVVAG